MSSSGYLVPPDQDPEQAELWNETWKRLNRFLPNLFEELFPEEAKKPPPGAVKMAERPAEARSPAPEASEVRSQA